ncbi:hypothetical protein CDL15_Pgr023001 [Punica granatum]|uniref:CNNM transmembrane domain-containing protein n=1 Tax=Punica granatum TaxID=22663 RepID=A0A218X4E5_PUNGR|nr:hypothetical protein CDL15_Pgr023001 [Punica granatum]
MRLRENIDVPCCSPEFWVFLAICLVLVSFAGITSGLALGLLSFGQVDLEVLVKAGQPRENNYAAKILPLIKNEHLLLCTLLVAKSLAMEALPIFLDSILPSWAAILMSVTLAIAFAEIIPQAVCSRYGLQIGAKLALLVRLLLLIFFPVAYPISKAGKGGDLSHHETTIITGALDLTNKTARDAMTPLPEIFSLDINSKLDMITMGLIASKGYCQIPIYSGTPKNILALILVKDLIFCRPKDETPIKHTTIRRIPRVYEDWPLYDVLNLFQKGHGCMAIVLKGKEALDDDSTLKRSPSKHAVSKTNKNSIPKSIASEIKEGAYSWTNRNEFSMYTLPLCYCIHFDALSPTLKPREDVKEKSGDTNPHFKRRVRRSGAGTLSSTDLESLASISSTEEVIGIITMKDVIEELLQDPSQPSIFEEIITFTSKGFSIPASAEISGAVPAFFIRSDIAGADLPIHSALRSSNQHSHNSLRFLCRANGEVPNIIPKRQSVEEVVPEARSSCRFVKNSF